MILSAKSTEFESDPWSLGIGQHSYSRIAYVRGEWEPRGTAVAAMPAIHAAGTHALAVAPLCIVLLSLSFSVHPHL